MTKNEPQHFFVPGRLPGENEIIAAAKQHKGKAYYGYKNMKKTCDAAIQKSIKVAKIQPMAACALTLHWREPNARRDPDNIVAGKKFILDALVEAGILKNDSQKYVKGFSDTWEPVTHDEGVMVTLSVPKPRRDSGGRISE